MTRLTWKRRLAPVALAALLGSGVLSIGVSGQSVKLPDVLPIPETPAFTFLGSTPTIERPGTARTLLVSLLNAVDSAGRARQGLGIEVAPFSAIPGWQVSLYQYQHSRLSYALANTTISFGTAAVPSDSASTDLALGLRTTFFDRSDLMADSAFTGRLRALSRRCLVNVGPATSDSVIRRCLRDAQDSVRALATRRGQTRWNSASLSAAVAAGSRLPQSEPKRGQILGAAAWVNGAGGLGAHTQLIGQVRFDRRRPAADSAYQSSLAAGARALVGTARWHAFAEAVERGLSPANGGGWKWSPAFSAGLEFRASDVLWVSSGFGTTYSQAAQPTRVVVVANMRWNVFGEPLFLK